MSKLNLGTPTTKSKPTIPANKPNVHEIKPFKVDELMTLAMVLNPKTETAKYSCGPNLSANRLSKGAVVLRKIKPIVPPIKEEIRAVPIAFAANPFLAKGRPSNVVAIEEGVPGIPNSIAEYKPPEIAPTYIAHKIANARLPTIVKVRGVISAIAIVAFKPGIAPMIKPPTTLKNIKKNVTGFISVRTASNNMSNFLPQYLKLSHPIAII